MWTRDHGTPGARAGAYRRPGRARRAWLPVCLLLAACAPAGDDARGPASRAALPDRGALPPMQTFAAPRPMAPQRANRDIMRDFLDLSFQMESGRTLPRFSRFEGPVTVRLTGAPPARLATDLDRLIDRLRTEADLNIRRVTGGGANITIEAIPRALIRRYVPTAACFVVPDISRITEYRQARRLQRTDWTRITRRDRIAIFVPNDSSPQEARDCLHEELAQSLGPLNDLYRLSDSVFNDDNMHAVLTGFDMLILRTYYAPELTSGMTRQEVAARLPAILSRLNPKGDRIASLDRTPTPRAWIDAMQAALGPGTRPAARRTAAAKALRIAQASGLAGHRRGFSHFALGKLVQGSDPGRARDQFLAADQFFRRSPGTDIHRAHVGVHLASQDLEAGRGDDALKRLAPHVETAKRHENAALLATLLMLRADALDLTGDAAEARRVRLDSLGWARYGYGLDWSTAVTDRRARREEPKG